MDIQLSEMLAKVLSDANQQAVVMQQRAKILEELEQVGVGCTNPQSIIKYGVVNNAKKSDLPKIRKVVGRLKVVGKDTAWNFETTNELEVWVMPVNKQYPIKFKYRTQFRKGGKCRVVQHSSAPSNYTSLVCDV